MIQQRYGHPNWDFEEVNLNCKVLSLVGLICSNLVNMSGESNDIFSAQI